MELLMEFGSPAAGSVMSVQLPHGSLGRCTSFCNEPICNASNTQLCSHWKNFSISEGILYAIYFLVEGWWVQQRHFFLHSLSCWCRAGGTVLLGDLFSWKWHFSLHRSRYRRGPASQKKPLFLLMQLEVWCLLQELREERIPHGRVCLNTACSYSFLQTAVQKSKCQNKTKR